MNLVHRTRWAIAQKILYPKKDWIDWATLVNQQYRERFFRELEEERAKEPT